MSQRTPACVLWVTVSRALRITAILVVLVAFIGFSFGLARVLSARAAERTALESLIADQAAGRGSEVTDSIGGCSNDPDCAKRVEAMVGRVAAPDDVVKVLQITQGTPLSPGGGSGVARIAWRTEGSLPVVQCVVVRRTGDVVSGFSLDLVAVSRPIGREASCPEQDAIRTAA